MLDSVIHLRGPIKTLILQHREKGGLMPLQLTDAQWDLLAGLAQVLKVRLLDSSYLRL